MRRNSDAPAKLAMLALLVASSGAVFARQSAPPAEPPPAQSPPPEKNSDPLPDLDDLLGLPKAPARPGAEPPPSEPPPADAPADLNKQELERKLTAQEMNEKFRNAVRQMGESADRIERAGDLGIVTQRLHEEILRNLDVLIKQSQDSSSSSGSSSSSSSQSDEDAKRAAQQKQQKGGQNPEAGPGENRGEAMPPAMTAAERQARLDTARAAWGNLPERVRDSLLEGSSDYFSSLYEAMTEAYYKKIAEEAKE